MKEEDIYTTSCKWHLVILLLRISCEVYVATPHFITHRLSDQRAAGCCHKPDNQTTNHDVFPVVTVPKVAKERGQKQETADENCKYINKNEFLLYCINLTH